MSVKKVLISLGHPAHFQLFKNVINSLNKKGIETIIVIRKKDILEDLLKDSKLPYYNILSNERDGGKLMMIWSLFLRDLRLLRFCLSKKPDMMIGSTAEITHVGKLLRIPAVSVGEDDMDVVPLFAKIVAPYSDCMVFPEVCNMGVWEKKSLKYNSYQELAYLHPNHFTAEKEVVEKYFKADKPYFIIRFSKLSAHHDDGIEGINVNKARKIIAMLKPFGDIYITSERVLDAEFEMYRMAISPLDIHHVMAFAQIYIGDSQTMAAESGVLGVPFIRINDFVGRISYLKELEEIYELGYGVKPAKEEELYECLQYLLQMKNRKDIFEQRRDKMLQEKIDVEKFLTWFIADFPASKHQMIEDPTLPNRFK